MGIKVPNRYTIRDSNYDKFPFVKVSSNDSDCDTGWDQICNQLQKRIFNIGNECVTVAVELYQGVFKNHVQEALISGLKPACVIDAGDCFLPESKINFIAEPFLTDDPVFGYMCDLEIESLMDPVEIQNASRKTASCPKGIILIIGSGASIICPEPDILIYADMARWEIQQRMRRNEVSNLGIRNPKDPVSKQYKRAYFFDWRICDKLKRRLFENWDYLLDTNDASQPKLVAGSKILEGLQKAALRPFRVVPFFDPGPWGGQWMKEVCDLERSARNFAWCFDCVPEENSLVLGFGKHRIEIPSINLVFYQPTELLGKKVREIFGEEFPIRFDFLDTMDGGNLSLQVHPVKKYIREKFGMQYTQDESYYFLEAGDDAFVYLGLKEGINPDQMIRDLEDAQKDGPPFNAEKYVQKWPVRKHDHVLIPAGTVHCSGKNSMVLEISATPYIFTFKLWDWGRMGLDGKPRPIHIEHGKEVIQWDRTEKWTKNELINKVVPVSEGDDWREEQTGLHPLEFIETRRHWFTKKVLHDTNGGVTVMNLVSGREAIIESPSNAFEPFIIHYAETCIIPAAVGTYTVRPFGESEGHECATIKAYVRI
jgi:mannose-6-phosphate isomerase class I